VGVSGRLVGAIAVILPMTVAVPLSVPGPAHADETDPVNLTPPTVSGEPVFHQRLRASPGTWDVDELTFAYQWLRDGRAVKDATARRYRLQGADLGARMSVRVTATSTTGGSSSATSAETGAVARADLATVARPRVSGVKRFAHRLRATPGRFAPKPAHVRYRWLRDGNRIRGATKASYLLSADDVGHRLRVQVTARRDGYRPLTVVSGRTSRIGQRVPLRRTVKYHVETRGKIKASLATFKAQSRQTYADPRGWRGAGIGFKQVAKGGSFTLVLAEASWLPRFSPSCSAQWSCRVGRYVIINQTRWLHASPAWRAAGRSVRDYRTMVVNHETGHWLGHGHASCPGRGKLAPVMMQQSKGRAGCRFNPWPLPSELWARPGGKLG